MLLAILTAILAARGPTLQVFRSPDVSVWNGRLGVSIPLRNTGDATAPLVTVTAVTLGATQQIDPVLPWVLGDLPPNGYTVVTAGFPASQLSTGARLLLTVRGTYRIGREQTEFTLETAVAVPPLATPPPALVPLDAHLRSVVDSASHTWSYELVNDEAPGSPRYALTFSIDMVGPFTVTGTPPGWQVRTDNLTSVVWFVPDSTPPAAIGVAPGARREGFRIRSTSGAATSEGRAYVIGSWNRVTNQADRLAFGSVRVPVRP